MISVVYGASVPLIMKYWFLKPAYAGVIWTYALIGAALGSLVFGRLADKIGRKKTIILCTTLFSVCMIICPISPNPVVFGIFRVLCGVGVGGAIRTLSPWLPNGHRYTIGR